MVKILTENDIANAGAFWGQTVTAILRKFGHTDFVLESEDIRRMQEEGLTILMTAVKEGEGMRIRILPEAEATTLAEAYIDAAKRSN